jgi:hypothetical protein
VEEDNEEEKAQFWVATALPTQALLIGDWEATGN